MTCPDTHKHRERAAVPPRPGRDPGRRTSRFVQDRQRIQRRLLSAGALADGRRLSADPGEWRHAFQAHPAFDTLRGDWRDTLGHIVHAMATLAHLEACVVRASREVLSARASQIAERHITVHQVKRGVRVLRESGLLETLECGRARSASHPRARVPLYALTVPVLCETVLPQRTPAGKGRSAAARRAERHHKVAKALGLAAAVDGSAPLNRGYNHGGTTTPLTPRNSETGGTRRLRGAVRRPRPRRGKVSPKSEARYEARLLAAQVPHSMTFSRIPPGQQARLLLPFAVGGWSGHDVAWALAHTPSGDPHAFSDRVRFPASWARWRLGLWLDANGAPLPGRWEQLGGAPGRERSSRRLLKFQDRDHDQACAPNATYIAARAAVTSRAR